MIFLDKPFVSDFLKETIQKNGFPVFQTDVNNELKLEDGLNLLDEASAIQQIRNSDTAQLYTNSENSIGWISQNLSFLNLSHTIDLFKDKAKFRTLIKPMHPDFFFKEIPLEDLDNLSVDELPMPFIIKPTTGFFSMGVHKVTDPKEWEQTKITIRLEMLSAKDLYPVEVLNTTSLIIEQNIEGEEFAIDAYYDAVGEPVILNIYKHLFSSDQDVSDRVYISSKEIIENNLSEFSKYLIEIGKLAELKNFPVHVEIRRDTEGSLLPIEINPMRFGGLCSTADMTYFSYGFNPYEYYFSQERPDWDAILKKKTGLLYSIIVLDNSTGIEGSQIESFDYELLRSYFNKPLELRKINFKEYPIFGFLFTETKAEDFSELERILKSNLREFITLHD